jgi:hypothetical protein
MTDIVDELDLLIRAAEKYERGDSDFPPYTTSQTLKAAKAEIERLWEIETAHDESLSAAEDRRYD